MKRQYLYLLLVISAILSPKSTQAQHITALHFSPVSCPYLTDTIFVTGTDTAGAYVVQHWGDGFIGGIGFNYGLGFNWVGASSHQYITPGTYTLKSIYYQNYIPRDSVYSSYTTVCNFMAGTVVYDQNSNCIWDIGEKPIPFNTLIEIDSSNIAIDTISCAGGFYYAPLGPVNTVYQFRVLHMPDGLQASCTGSDVFADTVGVNNRYFPKSFLLSCGNPVLHDLFAVTVPIGNGHELQEKKVYVNNAYCLPVASQLTVYGNDKYPEYGVAFPPPDVTTADYRQWNLNSVASYNACFQYTYFAGTHISGPELSYGDTIHTHINLSPIGGDANPSNNDFVVVDTVKSGFDPNEMLVSPAGTIPSGTQLQYIINFENTGNDTAFNIYVMDTLSDNVDIKTMNLVTTSAKMNVYYFKAGGHNIVKFDFPGINLLDSSHHNLCDGMVMFNINAKENLPIGTTIFNYAGIFFDDNPVVMTDTVENIIGHPESVSTVTVNDVSIYPNPASTELTIKATSAGYTTLQITNTLGQQVLQQPFSGKTDKVNIQQLPAGMYYLQLKGDKNITVKKFEKL